MKKKMLAKTRRLYNYVNLLSFYWFQVKPLKKILGAAKMLHSAQQPGKTGSKAALFNKN